jgi:hypothetical protein
MSKRAAAAKGTLVFFKKEAQEAAGGKGIKEEFFISKHGHAFLALFYVATFNHGNHP